MKTILYAAASLMLAAGTSAPALARQDHARQHMNSSMDSDGRQGTMNPNGPGVPPGDGISMRGHDPEGQAFTPPGYNMSALVKAYPPVVLAPAGLIGGDYPVCSARVTDRCVQAYTRHTRTASRW